MKEAIAKVSIWVLVTTKSVYHRNPHDAKGMTKSRKGNRVEQGTGQGRGFVNGKGLIQKGRHPKNSMMAETWRSLSEDAVDPWCA